MGTARQLFGRATEAAPSHVPSWQAWAVMEWERGRTKRARELFTQGVDATAAAGLPPHAPLLVAWATAEGNIGNTGEWGQCAEAEGVITGNTWAGGRVGQIPQAP